jgi:AraC-like DNA-binding protein
MLNNNYSYNKDFQIQPFVCPPFNQSVECYDSINLCLLTKGVCTEKVGNKTIFIDKPNITLNYPQIQQKIEVYDKALVGLEINFDMQWFEKFRSMSKHLAQPIRSFQDLDICFFAQKIQQELQCTDNLSALSLESIISELLITMGRELHQKEHYRPKWLKLAQDKIKDDPTADFSLDDLAKEANLHPTHFSRAFKQYAYKNLTDFIREERLKKAKEMLATTVMSITEISLSTGFFDQSHFSRFFKRQFGVTPLAYRQQMRR